MSLLRYKDLDLLEGIFSLWMSKGREAMDVKKAFDVRVRQLMQSRVENKVGTMSICYVWDGEMWATRVCCLYRKKIRIWVPRSWFRRCHRVMKWAVRVFFSFLLNNFAIFFDIFFFEVVIVYV